MLMDAQNLNQLDVAGTAANIKRIADERGFTIDQMAKSLGVTYQCVYRWLHAVNLPSLDNLVLLAQVLDVPISDLVLSAPFPLSSEPEV